jgi:formiminotetrahydrofolate cyclodeaminase
VLVRGHRKWVFEGAHVQDMLSELAAPSCASDASVASVASVVGCGLPVIVVDLVRGKRR